jgi:hypothetical protein
VRNVLEKSTLWRQIRLAQRQLSLHCLPGDMATSARVRFSVAMMSSAVVFGSTLLQGGVAPALRPQG